MAASAGTVTLNLDANSVKLLRELQKAERSTKKSTMSMGADFKRMAANTAKSLAVMGAAFAAMTTKMTRDGLKAVDAQAKMARALGGTNDALKALQMAAGDSGLVGLEASLNRMNRRLGAAEFGAGAAAVTVKALNLNLAELSKMDVDERLQSIANTMRDAGISTEQQARHLQNLGFEQATANEFFRNGITDLSQYKQEIIGLGLSLSDIDARKVEQANDAMGVFGDIAQGISQRLAVTLSPILRQVSEDILEMAMNSDGFASAIDTGFNFAVKAAGVVANAFRGLHLIMKGLVVAAYAISAAMAGVFAFVFNGIAPVIDFAIEQINRLIASVNMIPGVTIPLLSGGGADAMGGTFSEMSAGLKSQMQSAVAELQTLWGQDWPSETIEAYVANAREMAERAAMEASEAASSGFESFVDESETLTDRFVSIQEQAAKSMQSTFADFFFDPFKDGLKGMAESFVNVIRRMIAEAMALRAIMALSGMGGPIGSFFEMALPSRDSGGRGAAGQPYMIGRGAQPEIFIPDSAGTFIPNADKMGGQSLTINVDARDEGAEARIRDMINREMAPQIIAAAKGSTVAALRRPRFA